MSDERLDELAQRLFQAARAERPEPALRQRVQALGTGGALVADDTVASNRAASEAPRASGARSATRGGARGRAPWLAAAGLLSAAAAVVLFLGKRTLEPDTEVRISAEARSPSVITEPAVAPTAERAAEPTPSPAAVPALPNTEVAPAPEHAAPRAPSATPKRAAPPASPARQPAVKPGERASLPLAEQLELLEQARALLRSGQSTQALAVLDRYGALGGTDLRDEAALLRIEALAAQGRGAEAAEQARRFTEEHPDSPLAERARRLGGLR